MQKHFTITVRIALVLSFILAVLAAAAFRADQSLARWSGLALSAPEAAPIYSQEVNLSAADLAAGGTLAGLELSESGLVLGPGQLQGSVTSAPISSPLGFTTDVVPLWRADLPEGGQSLVETRLSSDGGQSWSEWLDNPEAFYPVRGDMHSGNLIWAGSSGVALQVRVTLLAGFGGGSPNLDSVTLVFNDTSQGPSDADIASQTVRVSSAENSCPVEKPAVVSRTDWGNPEGQTSPRRPPHYAPVTHAIIHQTETPNDTAPYQDYAGWVRSIWNFHANVLGWGDVGYNYLVDPNGVIYEGRAGGDDVIGIHDTHNAGSMGLGLIGCYGNCDDPRLSVAEPSAAMLNSTAHLIAWKFGQEGIDPLSSADYDGLSDIPVIAGGRDVVSTSAPGDNVYDKLPDLRDAVADKSCDGSAQACQITDIIFDKESYLVGETINVTVKLADYSGTPLIGAIMNATVIRDPLDSQASSPIDLDDQSGDYDGVYDKTSLPGYYNFTFTASDPTGERFQPCSAMTTVLVAEPGYETPTPLPTDLATETPTPTGTVPTETPTPTATATETPTVTTTPETPTATATSTPTDTPTATPTATTDPGPQGTALLFEPSARTITVCDGPTNIAVSVQDVANMTGAELHLTFNPAAVQVVDADPSTEKIEVQIGSGLSGAFVAQNQAFNTGAKAGTIDFAAILLGTGSTINGNANLINISFTPVNAGNSPLTIQNSILTSSTAGVTIDHQRGSGGITVQQTCNAATSGLLQLQGRTDHSGVTVASSDGQQTVTAADGSFTIAGSGPLTFAHPGFLTASAGLPAEIQGQAGDFAPVQLETVTLLAGDINGDHEIDILDLSYIAMQYGTSDTLADLNADGRADILDIALAALNFGQVGALATK